MALLAHHAGLPDRTGLQLEVTGQTHLGKVRRRNEDRICIGSWRSDHRNDQRQSRHVLGHQPLLLAVADGMGGYVGGEMAADTVVHRLQTTRWRAPRKSQVHEAVEAAVSDLKGRASRVANHSLMGSTVAAVLLDGNRFMSFNVGDSRVYLWREGWLRQLSTDDRDPDSGLLTQALTASAKAPTVHTEKHVLLKGDRLLLCSDGLTARVSDEEIAYALVYGAKGADNLMQLALDRGATDNISLVFAEAHTS